MGSRKHNIALERKDALKMTYFAKLTNCPTSPRKMRLVADMIRGKKIDFALGILKFSTTEASGRLEKILLSAIANWQAKNDDSRVDDKDLYIKEVSVDSGRQLKRLRPAPQGRGHRIRKRSNHITVIIESNIDKSLKQS